MYSYTGFFAGSSVSLAFRYPETGQFFQSYVSPSDSVINDGALFVSDSDLQLWHDRWKAPFNAETEYAICTYLISERLLGEKKAVFHGAAVEYGSKIILFTAPSGTGKTTQFRRWKEYFGDSVHILNGDKPILEICRGKQVMVHSSPWKGKENLGVDNRSLPLAAVISLKQKPYNAIEKMGMTECIRRLIGRIMIRFANEKDIMNAAQFLEGLLTRVPVFELQNKGDAESAVFTYEKLVQEGIIDVL